MCIRDRDPSAIVSERGMEQVSDTGAIEAVVDGVLAAFPDKVEQYKGEMCIRDRIAYRGAAHSSCIPR